MKAWQFWVLIAAISGLTWTSNVQTRDLASAVRETKAQRDTIVVVVPEMQVSMEPVIDILEQQAQNWREFAACLCEYTENPYEDLLERYKRGDH